MLKSIEGVGQNESNNIWLEFFKNITKITSCRRKNEFNTDFLILCRILDQLSLVCKSNEFLAILSGFQDNKTFCGYTFICSGLCLHVNKDSSYLKTGK